MIDEIVNKNLDKFILLLKQELADSSRKNGKINDTMKASNSLNKKKLNANNYQVLGVEYLEFLNKGRGGGKRPPIPALFDWVQTKLGVTDKKEALGIAFAVAKKIEKEGTEIFKDNSQGIGLTKNVQFFSKQLAKDISEGVILDIKEKLNKFANQRKK